jgi:hypothetical protein
MSGLGVENPGAMPDQMKNPLLTKDKSNIIPIRKQKRNSELKSRRNA